jgi:conserved hypothetical protein (putative transposase or invertase)
MSVKLVRFDWALKKLLRSKANFGILEGFLSELLDDDIKIVNILESEGNKESRQDKFNRVDIVVHDSKNEIILIEIQVDSQLDFLSRLLYGASKAVTEYMKESDPYRDIKKAFSIGILYFDLGQGEDYVYHGTTRFTGLHYKDELQLNEDQKLVYRKKNVCEVFPEYYIIRVNQFNDLARDTLDEWIYFLKNEEIKDEFKARGLKEAKEKLNAMKLPEQERKEYERYLEDLHYQASMVESSYGIGEIKRRDKGQDGGCQESIGYTG